MSLPVGLFGKLSLFLAGLFLLSAGLQWNDPDPLLWMLIYAAAGVASLMGAYAADARAAGRARALSALVGGAALVWAAFLSPDTLRHLTIRNLVQTMKAETPAIEASRELFGLLLIVAWMAAVFFCARSRDPATPTSTPTQTETR